MSNDAHAHANARGNETLGAHFLETLSLPSVKPEVFISWKAFLKHKIFLFYLSCNFSVYKFDTHKNA